MRILITGGAGFIGSHLCERLKSDGHELYVIDNLLYQVHGNPIHSPTFIKTSMFADVTVGDCALEATWKKFHGWEFDRIIFLASETGTGQSMIQAHSYCNSNINSLAILNDLIIKEDIKCGKLILASSRSIYGDADLDKFGNPVATKESDPKSPKSIYAVTKYAQEQLLFSGFSNTEVCALRFQNVYGPGQSLKNPYTGILSIFTNAMIHGKDVTIFSDGMMTRDFVFISDVIDSIILAINNQGMTSSFNVGSGKPTTVLHVANEIKIKLGSVSQIKITGEELKGDIRNNFADLTKISEFGFQPKIHFEQGLDLFLNWVKSIKNLESNNYEDSLFELRKNGMLKK